MKARCITLISFEGKLISIVLANKLLVTDELIVIVLTYELVREL